MNKPGRPKGTTQHPEKKTKNVTAKVTPTAWKWLQTKPRGWLANWIEEQARLELKNDGCWQTNS